MQRLLKLLILLTCLALLIHDAGSGRWRTFRPHQDDYYTRSLYGAVTYGDEAEVRRLIRTGADVNASDNSGTRPLHYAAYRIRNDVAALLISTGAQVNGKDSRNRTPLHLSASAAGIDMIHPLHMRREALLRKRKMAEFLIAKGAKVSMRDDWGMTPLDYAERHGNTEVAALLRKHGGKTGKEPDQEATK